MDYKIEQRQWKQFIWTKKDTRILAQKGFQSWWFNGKKYQKNAKKKLYYYGKNHEDWKVFPPLGWRNWQNRLKNLKKWLKEQKKNMTKKKIPKEPIP